MLMYMPYGKHQGRLMTEVPQDYLSMVAWCR